MKINATLITLVFALLSLTLTGCVTRGRQYKATYEDPSGKAVYDQKTVRGQPVTNVTVKSKIPGAAMGQAGVYGYGPYGYGLGPMGYDPGGLSGNPHTDTPSQDAIRCVRMVSGEYKGQIFCPTVQGVVPLVRQSSEPGEKAQDPDHRQLVENTARLQEIQECLKKGTCVAE